jgi:hypothetical protein
MKCKLPDIKDFDEKFISKGDDFKVCQATSNRFIVVKTYATLNSFKVNVYLVRDDGVVYNSGYSVQYSDAEITISSERDKESINMLETSD